MYSDWVLVLPLVAVFIWLGILTYVTLNQRSFLTKLFPKSGERDIRKKFEEVISFLESSESNFKSLKAELGSLKKEGEAHIQRVELLRYNPYEDTGGDISFSAAILDSSGNGLVVTSLHTRAGTRVFAKPVILGKPEKYQFSKEEAEVVKKALNR